MENSRMTRRSLIAGNWKMNGTRASLAELRTLSEAARGGLGQAVDLLICPPATLLSAAVETLGEGVAAGGQDCHTAASGAHTGDVSAAMLADLGARYVIVGHSERRADHGESDALVAEKAKAAWGAGLVAVICIGETEAERKAGETLSILGRQLAGSVPDGATGTNTVIAYEPVWAIGTGLTPTVADVADAHAFMRRTLTERLGAGEGGAVRLLYGGSVKPSNAAELLGVADVDGALVGGASLKAADFVAICEAAPRG
jgi:triosephosphate isomerase (TIM)